MAFKAGDRVRFVEDYSQSWKKGDEFVVTQIYQGRNGTMVRGDDTLCYDFRLELVKEAVPPMEKFVIMKPETHDDPQDRPLKGLLRTRESVNDELNVNNRVEQGYVVYKLVPVSVSEVPVATTKKVIV